MYTTVVNDTGQDFKYKSYLFSKHSLKGKHYIKIVKYEINYYLD